MSEAVSTTGIMVARGTEAAGTAITGNTAASPTVVTSAAHGLVTGQVARIIGSNAVPNINNKFYSVTVLTANTFSIPVDVTTPGTTGTVKKITFTEIGEIVSVTPPGFSRNRLESTTHNDGTESYVLGILRQRDVSFRINYVGTEPTHEQIVDDIFSNTKAPWQIVFPSGVEFIGDARVQRFEFVDAPTDGIQQADCALTWAGPIAMSVLA